MRTLSFFSVVPMTIALCWHANGLASETPTLDNAECAAVLETWASDPKAAPKRQVDQCKQQLSAADPGVRHWPAPAAGLPDNVDDPCAGPNAGASVMCWGPWSALAPAAGDAPPSLPVVAEVPSHDPRPEDASAYAPELSPQSLVPEPPLGSCTPGAPCGFATVVEGPTGNADAADTRFASVALAADGSRFSIDPGRPGQIDSVTGMNTAYLDRPDEFENLDARGRSGDEQSALFARVKRDPGSGELQVAADIWTHGNRASRTANSGYFAWGQATSAAGLSALASQGAIVSFSGPMSVDNRTTGSMTLDFGAQANWSGSWVNPSYSFTAGGPISGVDLVSDSSRFSANVLPGSLVQGALLGEPGNQSVAHIIEVNLSGTGLIRDVGLLSQSIGQSGP